MAADLGLEELQTRLRAFSEQLESIHELLESDPANDEFLGIARDLVEVIRLTKEMIDLKLSGGAADERPAQQTGEAAAIDATIELRFSPGTICEALSKGVWYPAFIESMTAGNAYNVHFLGFGSKGALPEAELRAVPPVPHIPLAGALPPRHAVAVGFQCEAKYFADGQFYACAVTAVTAHGFQVLFSGYGNSEEVPYEYLRALPPATGATAAGADTNTDAKAAAAATKAPRASTGSAKPAMAAAAAAVVAKPIKIPESLQILPGDSEAEKERKRKRQRAIKSLNRHKTIENERNAKQSGWQSFQHKAQKRRVQGATGVLSKKSTSMFAVPEGVGGRVGVVGSGQGMTAYHDGRKKLKTATTTAAAAAASTTPRAAFD
ncbi:hypothetical protein PybrP1_009995 [[Pythium] brassicae (nom. inval.)]|nr:hypothetical protein PybrP1_009995 [[Pythium] brassicae (nom. inval.)]